MRYKIKLINQKEEVEAEGGTLAEICALAGYPLNLVCGGRGTCKKCQVTIKRKGQTAVEEVLACKTVVDQDMEVYLHETDEQKGARILTESKAPGCLAFIDGTGQQKRKLRPSVKKKYFSREEQIPGQGGAFLQGASLPVMRKFSALCAEEEYTGCTFVYYRDGIVDVQKGDTTTWCYGAAIDLGTTTVACYFYDLVHGRLLATKSAMNRQIIHGADVIARNAYSQERPEHVEELQQLILDTINAMLEETAAEYPELKANLYHIVLCGNSMMQHLFYGLSPVHLGVAPFASITKDAVISRQKECGLHGAPEGIAEFLPLLGGFVGADTTAVLLPLAKEGKKQNYLVADLGTNGEIAVGDGEQFMVASTACGPALEGGNIACGMRGTEGAIETVSLANDQVELQVIGGGEALGLCGSGIVDAVAELYRVGLMDETGRLRSSREYTELYPGRKLGERIREVESYNPAFFFTEGERPVYLSQKDIRQIQLAKSSIYSGCMALLAKNGLTPDDVDIFLLAGAFGHYLSVEHALAIGLLPPVPEEKILSVGNGAGQGAQAFLLDDSYREILGRLLPKVSHMELASSETFMENYILHMNF